MIDPANIVELFDYQDGELIRRHTTAPRARKGDSAGTRTPDGYVITIDGKKIARRRLVWAWHHGVWPTHSVCSLNNDCFDDHIENLADLNDVERRHNLVEQQRAVPTGVAQAGKRFTASCDHEYLGTFDTAIEAYEAYCKAHVAKYGSMSPYAKGIITDATGVVKCL